MRNRLVVTVAAAAVLVIARLAAAGEGTDALKTRIDRVLLLLEEPGDRHAEIRKVADELFDWEEMSRRALGPHWNARTPEEQREFVTLFADLLERSYRARVESGRGGKVLYTAESMTGDEAMVRTRIVTSQRTEVPVDYRMHRRDQRWRVYDVNIEGISLINNYRSQFNSVIQSSSYAALVERLRSKETDAAASPPSLRRSRRDERDAARATGRRMSGRHPDVTPATLRTRSTLNVAIFERHRRGADLASPTVHDAMQRTAEERRVEMTKTLLHCARIEYQLDVRSAQPRIPLGAIVLAADAHSVRMLVTGRAPRVGSPPPEELKTVGPLGRSQLDGWVAAMAKDVLASIEKHEDPLDILVSTWCWNLSVTVIDDVAARPGEKLRDVATRLLPAGILNQPSDWSIAEASFAGS